MHLEFAQVVSAEKDSACGHHVLQLLGTARNTRLSGRWYRDENVLYLGPFIERIKAFQ